jgi:hypothetical protein
MHKIGELQLEIENISLRNRHVVRSWTRESPMGTAPKLVRAMTDLSWLQNTMQVKPSKSVSVSLTALRLQTRPILFQKWRNLDAHGNQLCGRGAGAVPLQRQIIDPQRLLLFDVYPVVFCCRCWHKRFLTRRSWWFRICVRHAKTD